jgi:TP901 family phage tail tape measure protein
MAENIATLVARLEGDISGFRASMGEAERRLNSFEARARRTSDGAAQAFSGIGLSWASMVRGLAVVGVGLSIGSLVRDGAAFEQQMNVIRAQSGATGEEMRRLEGSVRRLGVEYGIGADAASTAARELLKSGVDIEDVNAGALRSSIALARVLGDDYASAATIAATAMSVFGLSARDLSDVVQGIAGTVLAGRFELQDYALALQQGGSAARLAGLDIDDFNTLLLLFQRRIGGSGSDMGTLSRVLLQRLVPASEEARRRMEELGLEFFDAQGRFIGLDGVAEELRETFSDLDQEARQRDFNLIFGTDALRGAAALMEEGADGVERYRTELDEQAKVAAVAKALTEGLSGAVAELSAEWQDLGITLMEAGLSQFLQDAVHWASELVRELRQAVEYIARLVPAVDTSADLESLTQQLAEQTHGLESAQRRLDALNRYHDSRNEERDGAMSRHYRQMIAEYERNIADLQAIIANGGELPTVAGGAALAPPGPSDRERLEAQRRREEAERRRREYLESHGVLDRNAVQDEYERALQQSQGEYGRYVDTVTRLLQLSDQLPAVSANIGALIRQATGDYVRGEAAARGLREEYEQVAREAPALLRPLAEALANDLNRIGQSPEAAAEGFMALRAEVERFMDVMQDMHGRVELFDRFDDLSRSLRTQAERIREERAEQMLELETLAQSGLFPAADVEELRRRIQDRYVQALSRVDGVEGAAVRLAGDVNDIFRGAFVRHEWDFASLGDTLQQSFRQALWDAVLGDDLDRFLRAIALNLESSISGLLGDSSRPWGVIGDIFAGLATTGASSQSGDGGGFWGAALGAIASLFGGFFADGGALQPGQWGIAGEDGPEPIFAGRAGLSVIPNDSATARGGDVIHVTIHANDAVLASKFRMEMAQAVAQGVQLARAQSAGDRARADLQRL